jgi:hypothetical protein
MNKTLDEFQIMQNYSWENEIIGLEYIKAVAKLYDDNPDKVQEIISERIIEIQKKIKEANEDK